MLCTFAFLIPSPPTSHIHSLWSITIHAAYRAYNVSSLLDVAIRVWDAISLYQITPENAASGTHPLKNSSFSPTCGGGIV